MEFLLSPLSLSIVMIVPNDNVGVQWSKHWFKEREGERASERSKSGLGNEHLDRKSVV